MNISFSDRVEIPKHVLVRSLENESVLLNLKAEVYYGLDEVGTRIWRLVTTAPNIERAFEQLVEEFDVEAPQLRQDLADLLGRLVDHGLLRIHAAGVESASTI